MIAPEKLLRALLLQVLYSVCSERMLMEAGDSFVLDVALRARLPAGEGARFARGAVRKAHWPGDCADKVIGHPTSLLRLGREFEQEIMECYRAEYMVDGALSGRPSRLISSRCAAEFWSLQRGRKSFR